MAIVELEQKEVPVQTIKKVTTGVIVRLTPMEAQTLNELLWHVKPTNAGLVLSDLSGCLDAKGFAGTRGRDLISDPVIFNPGSLERIRKILRERGELNDDPFSA